MDQSFSIHPPSASSSGSQESISVVSEAAAPTPRPDEEPDSPGRSPRTTTPGESGSDPLAEGLGLLAGAAIALLTLMVPLATVVCDPRAPEPAEVTRVSW